MRYEPGEAHPNARLTEQDVQDIRRMYKGIRFTQQEIAEIFGISQAQVSRIINRILWGSVKDERKNGKWIHDWESCWSTCSACGEGYLWEDNDGVGEWNFCPNCGADMREAK